MKLALNTRRKNSYVAAVWTESLPFVENNRAVLIHRPKSVQLYNIHKSPHLGVQYWCGNGAAGSSNFTFIEQPPEGKLVCLKCDEAAVTAGHPSTHEICGRHIHMGRVVPLQVCCEFKEPTK